MPDDDFDYGRFNMDRFALSDAELQSLQGKPPRETKHKKPPVEPYVHLNIRWWLKVKAFNKEHPKAEIWDLAIAISHLHGLKYKKGLDAACLNKFNINPRTAQRNLHLMEKAGLVVVERSVCGNRPPVVTPIYKEELS